MVHFDPKTGVAGIRLATASDEDDIFALLLLLHGENGIFTVNPNKVRLGIRYATQRQGAIIFVNEGPKVFATLGLMIVQDWYSDDEYLCERWNFVHPDHRRTDYARRLIEQAKWSSEYFRAHGKRMPLLIGINSCIRTEAKVRLYARHMPCIGATFMYGEPPAPLFAERVRAESANVEEMNRKAHRERSREVVPLVETILKLSCARAKADV
jgi:GNAT superfamily N-acetyltransferase